MQNAILVGLSRQVALARELDVVANNIANLNTTGYKADGSLFEEYLNTAARADQTGSRVSFVRDRGIWHDMSQGAIERTGNPLDVAIDGQGFLVVQTPPASATPATARCRSTPPASSSPATAIRCSATAARSRCSRTTGRSRSATTARSACAKAPRRSIPRAASCGWSPSPTPQRLQKDGGSTFNATAGATPQPATNGRPGARRDRKIQRARRRRDVAHDRNHPQPTPRSTTCCSNRTTSASRRSTSSPKFRIDADGELDPCARSAPLRPA